MSLCLSLNPTSMAYSLPSSLPPSTTQPPPPKSWIHAQRTQPSSSTSERKEPWRRGHMRDVSVSGAYAFPDRRDWRRLFTHPLRESSSTRETPATSANRRHALHSNKRTHHPPPPPPPLSPHHRNPNKTTGMIIRSRRSKEEERLTEGGSSR